MPAMSQVKTTIAADPELKPDSSSTHSIDSAPEKNQPSADANRALSKAVLDNIPIKDIEIVPLLIRCIM